MPAVPVVLAAIAPRAGIRRRVPAIAKLVVERPLAAARAPVVRPLAAAMPDRVSPARTTWPPVAPSPGAAPVAAPAAPGSCRVRPLMANAVGDMPLAAASAAVLRPWAAAMPGEGLAGGDRVDGGGRRGGGRQEGGGREGGREGTHDPTMAPIAAGHPATRAIR